MSSNLLTGFSYASLTSNAWLVRDDGRLPGAINMTIDEQALFAEETARPQIRFFQWSGRTITYGYLLDIEKVKAWALEQNVPTDVPLIQRPTGGGAVLHSTSDLSFSLLWPRGHRILPEKARDCYEVIHQAMRKSLEESQNDFRLGLYAKPTGSCQETGTEVREHFSVCFQKPVCNDVMQGDKKIIGGALRVTRKAILYQGTIQTNLTELAKLKKTILRTFEKI